MDFSPGILGKDRIKCIGFWNSALGRAVSSQAPIDNWTSRHRLRFTSRSKVHDTSVAVTLQVETAV